LEGLELRVIHMFSRYEQVESGMELFKMRIFGHRRMNIFHVGDVFEASNLDPEILIFGHSDRRRKTLRSKLSFHFLGLKKFLGECT